MMISYRPVSNLYPRDKVKTKSGLYLWSPQVIGLKAEVLEPWVLQLKNLSVIVLFNKDTRSWHLTTYSFKMGNVSISFPELQKRVEKMAIEKKKWVEYLNTRWFWRLFLRRPATDPSLKLTTVEELAVEHTNNFWVFTNDPESVKPFVEYGKMVDRRIEEINQNSSEELLLDLGFKKMGGEEFLNTVGYELPD